MIYLAIDPGLATGLAWLVGEGGGPYKFTSDIIDTGDRFDVEEFVAQTLAIYNDITVIIESWEVRKNTFTLSNQEDPRYILGAVEYLCRSHNVTYHEQTAGQMKAFANRPVEFHKVRRLGWHKSGPGHDNDAAGHLITYLVNDRSKAGDWMRNTLAAVL